MTNDTAKVAAAEMLTVSKDGEHYKLRNQQGVVVAVAYTPWDAKALASGFNSHVALIAALRRISNGNDAATIIEVARVGQDLLELLEPWVDGDRFTEVQKGAIAALRTALEKVGK